MPKPEMYSALLWLTNFILLALWGIVGFFMRPGSTTLYNRTKYTFSAMFLPLYIAYCPLLDLSWYLVLALLLVLVSPSLPLLLTRGRAGLSRHDITSEESVSSWFAYAATFVILGYVLQAPLWFVGAAIIFTYGLFNLYWDRTVKKYLHLLGPSIDRSLVWSGLIIYDELPLLLSGIVVALFFFPFLLYVPALFTVVGRLVSTSVEIVIGAILTLFGMVTTFFAAMAPGQASSYRRMYASVYRGYILLLLLVLGLMMVGYVLSSLNCLNVGTAVGTLYSLSKSGKNCDTLTSSWLAAILTACTTFSTCSIILVFLVIGGRSECDQAGESKDEPSNQA